MEGSFLNTQRWCGCAGWFAVLVSLVLLSVARSEERVVVLRNGRVLTGEVLSLGDMFLVSLGERDEVHLPKAAVEMICQDLEQAYQRKRATVAYGDLAAHLNLATWSLRNGLFGRAADQLLVIHSIQPNHPGLEAACRALDAAAPAPSADRRSAVQNRSSPRSVVQIGSHASQPRQVASAGIRSALAESVDAVSPADPAITAGADDVVPATFLDRVSRSAEASRVELNEQQATEQRGTDQQVTEQRAGDGSSVTTVPKQTTSSLRLERPTTVSADSVPAHSAGRPADKPRSADAVSPQLRNSGISIRNLPVGVVELFTKEVQPYLLNRCATNACHGSDRITTQSTGPRLTLTRPRVGEAHSRRRTEQNLASVMQFVNRRAPEKSPLLTVPAKPHGDRPMPLLDSSSHFLLHRWLRGLGESTASRVITESEVDGRALVQDYQTEPHALPELSVDAVGAGHAEDAGSSPARQKVMLKKARPPEQTRAADEVQQEQAGTEETEVADGYEPRDPFDPELFNRRWLSNKDP